MQNCSMEIDSPATCINFHGNSLKRHNAWPAYYMKLTLFSTFFRKWDRVLYLDSACASLSQRRAFAAFCAARGPASNKRTCHCWRLETRYKVALPALQCLPRLSARVLDSACRSSRRS